VDLQLRVRQTILPMQQAERAKNVESVLTAAEISKQRDDLIYFATPWQFLRD
jgi:hypothetical protein